MSPSSDSTRIQHSPRQRAIHRAITCALGVAAAALITAAGVVSAAPH